MLVWVFFDVFCPKYEFGCAGRVGVVFNAICQFHQLLLTSTTFAIFMIHSATHTKYLTKVTVDDYKSCKDRTHDDNHYKDEDDYV